ncbi:TonB-dependent receptor [Novosphingobium umbonatum]|uniref:TonB-dependent receptor n=1 Tax=Novosphingobium umbonatum TaxID=1908524 RepID=A0A3S2VE61_9SPHN|nr:TonB-dependent receptor [Novosphingobium umbonatum]RVU05813.1 TonB-dependent receptor [Novosphingobium umbonatum]
MRLSITRSLCAGSMFALVLGLSSAAVASEAPAAPSAAGDADLDAGLEVITVTAQKRSENLQNTPIAISVLSAKGLENRHVTSLLDLGDGAIPSLKVAPFFSRPGALIVNVRGVGVLSDSNQPARDQGVGVYVDGVYQGRAQGLGTALFDVENIEVLKGPQGTLFGRNTEGGAVNIVTKKPSGTYKLNATAGIGNYGSHKGEVHLDLPSFANIALKIDAVVAKRDPFVANPLSGQLGFNSYDKRGVHVEAYWKPSDSFSADLSADKSYDATSTLYLQQISAGTGLPAAASGSAAVLANTTSALFRASSKRASSAIVGVPQQASIGKAQGTRLSLEWKPADKLTLRSISSYREMTQTQYDNGSADTTLQQATVSAGVAPSFASFQFARMSLAPFRQNQVSQELQVIGEMPRFKYQAGGLYYVERVQDAAQAFNTMAMTSDVLGSAATVRSINYDAQTIQRASHVKTTSKGLYGQATYTPALLNDAAHLTVGARWTNDKKEGSLFLVNGAAPIVPVNGVNVQAPVLLNASWSRVDPMINLAVDASRDVHLYAKWSTGYRSGGANSRSLSYRAFNPETVSMFELGAKTEFWDHRARLNLAAYAGNYKNIQLDFSGLYEDVVNGVRVATTRTTTDTVNAPGTGHLKGFEAEFTLAPVDGLTLSASYAYNHVSIPATVNPFPQTGGVFITVPVPIYQVYTPEHSASATLDYETKVALGDAKLRFHLDGNYDSGFYANYTDSNYDTVTREVRYKQPKGDAALIFNGRVALADVAVGDAGAKLTFAVWARNLFNEEHLFYKSGSAAAGVSGFFNDPRTFGGEINIKF